VIETFPDPRKPVSIVTGIFFILSSSNSATKIVRGGNSKKNVYVFVVGFSFHTKNENKNVGRAVKTRAER
jgi:hypothetical protein